jgi:hypothetical protein
LMACALSCSNGCLPLTDPTFFPSWSPRLVGFSPNSASWVETNFLNTLVRQVALYDRFMQFILPSRNTSGMTYLVHKWIPGVVKVRFWIEINYFLSLSCFVLFYTIHYTIMIKSIHCPSIRTSS